MKHAETATARRTLLLGAALALAAAFALPPAQAAEAAPAEGTAEALILRLTTEVLDGIRADKAIRAGDFDREQKLINEKIMPNIDFDKMTRLTVGRPWRGATPEQRSALIEQFRALLLRTYAGALSRVTDEKVRLQPSHGQEATATDTIVRTLIVASQGDPISIDYRLEKTDAGWKIYDLSILNVWLVENYKNEFLAPLNQGGVDNLIQTLIAKNRQAAGGAKAG